MKRIARKLVIYLLLGAILNVMVAWCCILGLPPHVLRHDSPKNERHLNESENIALLHRFVSDAPMQLQNETYGKEQSWFGWTQSVTMWTGDESEMLYICSNTAGLPTPSVQGASV